MPAHPTGTVTFLFTDIERSTSLWESDPSAMHAAVDRHEEILRSAIADHEGFTYKQIGDAFQAAFGTAIDALSAALAAQKSLHAEAWGTGEELRVRMALHTGVTEEREGDYVGPLLNRVARLLSCAHGGQVLLTAATEELVRDTLPDGATLRDLGEHRLKDLIRPEHIYQLEAPEIPSGFPPLRALSERPNNLPLQPTSLVGRGRELAAIQSLLLADDTHILTLTGPGGTGKTRLALQVAAETLNNFADGAFVVFLAPLVDHALVIPSIAQKFGLHEVGNRPFISALEDYLSAKQILLILDNFEQVIEAAPEIADLSAHLPGVKMLITSRVELRLSGEREFLVPPLETPGPGIPASADLLSECESVTLFVERARAVKPDFVLDSSNAATVAGICRRLDGLPLAIELAAARVRLLPPHALLPKLENSLRLLTGGPRDSPARQQTLRNTIDWSYDLLDGREQVLFRRLGVFHDPMTLDEIEAVCAGEGELEIEVLDGVESLVAKSLLMQVARNDGEPRLLMLTTIHEYARDRLEESGEFDNLRKRHAAYMRDLSEKIAPHLFGRRQRESLSRLQSVNNDLRAALVWAEEKGEWDDLLRMVAALWRFWEIRGYHTEGRTYLKTALASSASNSGARLSATQGAATLAWRQGEYEAALALYDESLALGRQTGNRSGMALTLNNMGLIARYRGDLSHARRLIDESMKVGRETGDTRTVAAAMNSLGDIEAEQGDYAEATRLYNEGLGIFEDLGDTVGIAASQYDLGEIARNEGNHNAARSHFETSLDLFRELGNRSGIAACLDNLGVIAQSTGDYKSSESFEEESLRMRRELGDRKGVAESLASLGVAAYSRADQERAESLMHEALDISRAIGDRYSVARLLCYLGLVDVARGEITTGTALIQDSLRLRRELGDRRGIAEGIEGLAKAAEAAGDRARASRLSGAAACARGAMGSVPAASSAGTVGVEYSTAGADDSADWREGHAMTLEQAVAFALCEDQSASSAVTT